MIIGMLIGFGVTWLLIILQFLKLDDIFQAVQNKDSQKEAQLTQELKQSADALQSGIDSNKPK